MREPPRSSSATHSALRDGVVRVGSLCLNHPELVHHVLSSEIYLDSCCRLSLVPGLSYRDDAKHKRPVS